MSVNSGDEDDPLEFVEPHEEIELVARRLLEGPAGIGRGEPGGAVGNCLAVVARDLQMLVTELNAVAATCHP